MAAPGHRSNQCFSEQILAVEQEEASVSRPGGAEEPEKELAAFDALFLNALEPEDLAREICPNRETVLIVEQPRRFFQSLVVLIILSCRYNPTIRAVIAVLLIIP